MNVHVFSIICALSVHYIYVRLVSLLMIFAFAWLWECFRFQSTRPLVGFCGLEAGALRALGVCWGLSMSTLSVCRAGVPWRGLVILNVF